MRKCPECDKELSHVRGVGNTHITGDTKDINVVRCEPCAADYLFISMEATMSYGDNYFSFLILLTCDESERILEMMRECPSPHEKSCKCPVHGYLDRFDRENSHRRTAVEDIVERWERF